MHTFREVQVLLKDGKLSAKFYLQNTINGRLLLTYYQNSLFMQLLVWILSQQATFRLRMKKVDILLDLNNYKKYSRYASFRLLPPFTVK